MTDSIVRNWKYFLFIHFPLFYMDIIHIFVTNKTFQCGITKPIFSFEKKMLLYHKITKNVDVSNDH